MVPEGFHKAYYRSIPCYFNMETHELEGRNWFYDILVVIAAMYDANFSDGFYIYVEKEDDDV